MPENANVAQGVKSEAKPERSTIQLTPEEKRVVRVLAGADLISESDLIRRFIDFDGMFAAYERQFRPVEVAQEPAA